MFTFRLIDSFGWGLESSEESVGVEWGSGRATAVITKMIGKGKEVARNGGVGYKTQQVPTASNFFNEVEP